MSRSLWLIGALLLLGAALTMSCDGDNGDNHGNGNDGETPPSPEGFTMARDDLVEELDSIGVNIGIVPADIRDDLLEQCRELEAYVDPQRLDPLCNGISQAIDENDPGLIDLVVNELATLEPD